MRIEMKRRSHKVPLDVNVLFQEAVAQFQQGRVESSERLLKKIVKASPGHAEANHLLGILAGQRGQHALAGKMISRAIRNNPHQPVYYHNLSLALLLSNNYQEALAVCEGAIKINPNYAEAHKTHGDILRSIARLDEALSACDHAISLKPAFAEAHLSRGNVLKDLCRPVDALEAYEQVVKLKPRLPEAHLNCGIMLDAIGCAEEAEPCYREALRLRPDYAKAHSNLLFLLGAKAELPPDRLLAEQRAWDRIHGQAGRRQPMLSRPVRPLSGRRLRIGYVSPDFHGHAVSRFFEPLLAHHDRERFEIFCYDARVRQSDATTGRLQGIAERWRFVGNISDAELAKLIHQDGIDILIDLAGHTGDNRLVAFSYRPAPVQATYLGYFASTGLEAMDYWITDDVLHPTETTEEAVEQIYRLPRCSHCYLPPAEAPAVAPCPSDDSNVVFGSFSNLSKLTTETIVVWSEILHALPGSRLLLTTKYLDDPKTRELLIARFACHDINTSRLLLQSTPDPDEWLATYAKVDIVLDPFPRTGCTTTAEALWMGLPVVTLAGERYVERASTMVLAAVGLPELVADSQEAYVNKALLLARDLSWRNKLRTELRGRMHQSPLCDGKGLARAMEVAYRVMWEKLLSATGET